MQVDRLAGVLAGGSIDLDWLKTVRMAAEAELEVIRVRNARATLINTGTNLGAAPVVAQPMVAAISPQMSADALRHPDRSESDAAIAAALQRVTQQLARLDRYERRALSRRKRAIFVLTKIGLTETNVSQNRKTKEPQ